MKELENSNTTFEALRSKMVKEQIQARGIRDPAIIKAMLSVPREIFVSQSYATQAYEDRPLPIDEEQTISQPYIVAFMIDALKPSKAPEKILEIGTGSGYSAAVLGMIAEKVFSIERHPYLARTARKRMQQLNYENVEIREGDGTLGLPSEGPFDGIIVTAGGPDVPTTLLKQLKIEGRLVIPIGSEKTVQSLVSVKRLSEVEYKQENLGAVQFVPLIGAEGWKSKSKYT